jgi:hypothetical protein
MRFEVYTVVKIQVAFWVVMLCSVVVGCHCFGGPCCIYLILKMEAAMSSKTMVSFCITIQHHNLEDLNLNQGCIGRKD